MVVDEVLPDGHGVAATGQRLGNQLAVRLAGTRTRRAPRAGDGPRVGGHRPRGGRFWSGRGRWTPPAWWPVLAATPSGDHPAAHRHPGGLQIAAGRLPTDRGGLFDAPQRPAQSPQRQDLLLFLVVAQDVAHAGGGPCPPAGVNVSVATRGGRFSGVHQWPVLGVHRGGWVPVRQSSTRHGFAAFQAEKQWHIDGATFSRVIRRLR